MQSWANPAAMATGFPLNVPAWYTGPKGATISIISLFPPYAPTGIPAPIILPMVVKSGRTWKYSWAPPGARRNPVITSSKIKTAPYASQSFRRPSKNPGLGRTTPIFAATGSTTTAAISSPRRFIWSFTSSKWL